MCLQLQYTCRPKCFLFISLGNHVDLFCCYATLLCMLLGLYACKLTFYQELTHLIEICFKVVACTDYVLLFCMVQGMTIEGILSQRKYQYLYVLISYAPDAVSSE